MTLKLCINKRAPVLCIRVCVIITYQELTCIQKILIVFTSGISNVLTPFCVYQFIPM